MVWVASVWSCSITTAAGPVGAAPGRGTLTTRMRSVAAPAAGAAFCAVSDVKLKPVPSNRAAVVTARRLAVRVIFMMMTPRADVMTTRRARLWRTPIGCRNLLRSAHIAWIRRIGAQRQTAFARGDDDR